MSWWGLTRHSNTILPLSKAMVPGKRLYLSKSVSSSVKGGKRNTHFTGCRTKADNSCHVLTSEPGTLVTYSNCSQLLHAWP